MGFSQLSFDLIWSDMVRTDTTTSSRDGFTALSINWYRAIIWFGIPQGCYFISKMEAFSLINIKFKNNLSNNWNNPI